MDKNALWKWLALVVMVAASLALVYPPGQKVKLGLDLKGGVSFTVEIDKDEIRQKLLEEDPDLTPGALETEMRREAKAAREIALEVIRNRVDGLGIAEPVIYSASHRDQERIVVQLPGIDKAKSEDARAAIESVAFLVFRMVHERSEEWTKTLLQEGKAPKGYKVSETGEYYVRDSSGIPDEAMDRAFKEQLRKFEYKPGCEFFLERGVDPAGRTVYRPFYVELRKQLTGDSLKSAGVEYNPTTSAPYVTLDFDSKGARKFASVTRNYAPRGAMNRESDNGRQLAIILDDTLYSAPVISEEIPSGKATITGQFRASEAIRLANVLRAGSLPVPVRIVETREVDPTLGRDSIRSGAFAAILGAAAVFLFMLIYYRLAGVVANLALILDMLLLPLGLIVVSGFMGLFIAAERMGGGGVIELPTLTLPGIAGIALTIGMAVDANVLIYERIREELRAGKALRAAIGAGYEKAFSTIFDANITTLLTALILFYFGSGPVRGFAVTLSAGIVVSMLIVLVYTRLFFNTLEPRIKGHTLRMMAFFQKANIDFVGKRGVALILSLILIAATWAVFVARGGANFGVDFTGGSSLVMTYKQRVPVDALREALAVRGITADIQYQRELTPDASGNAVEYLDVRAGETDAPAIVETITQAFPDAGLNVVKEDMVGAKVGAELKRKAVWATLWALVGILVYVSLRFEFAFAVGAIAALAHDVLLTVGIYCLLGRELSLPIVAAVLTIVGYSVNDTIVVFDRIREDLKLYRGRPYTEIANLSINQTLSRTVLTSLTTLLTVITLVVFGGGGIQDMALALLIGILVGTYSSIFVATPVMLLWHREKKPAA